VNPNNLLIDKIKKEIKYPEEKKNEIKINKPEEPSVFDI
jgi:hypothetical protein